MHKHTITIFWSDEDDLFVASIPDLPGCIAYEEALYEAQVAMPLRPTPQKS